VSHARIGSFMLAAFASFALTMNGYSAVSHPLRVGLAIVSVILLHVLTQPRFRVHRELLLYGAFVAYGYLSLLWTDDVELALPTMGLALNFTLILLLFSIFPMYHDIGAMLTGALLGFLVAAAIYTLTVHFPFVYPDDFSYNSIAAMYLYGLILTVLFGWRTRHMVLTITIGLGLMLLIAATTSVKTNLGIFVGVCAAAVLYFRSFARVLRRIAIPLIVFAAAMTYAVMSSDALIERMNAGATRVSAGAQVLVAREDRTGVTEFGARVNWKDEGLRGWILNPMFGHGVEAFREDYGVTSHSTPIDLLYNSGLIGFGLFYALFMSIAWRMVRARASGLQDLLAILAATAVCYLFISLSATMYYDNYLAAYMGLCIGLIERLRKRLPGQAAAA
jgi:branched-subunit amino acid transport protein